MGGKVWMWEISILVTAYARQASGHLVGKRFCLGLQGGYKNIGDSWAPR